MSVSYTQVASDYYTPFCIGNQNTLTEPGSYENWGHTATFTFIQTDFIGNDICYLQRGTLYSHSGCCLPQVFHLLWLYKDLNGNIFLKAYSEEYPDIDSAVILSTPLVYFSNNFLTAGYSLTQTVEPGHSIIDSVVSTNASYMNFSNCIKIMETDIVEGIIENVGFTYYAYGVGKVGEQDVNGGSSSYLVSAFLTGCDQIVDTISPNIIDTCLGEYFDYYVNNIQVNNINNTVTVTWVFQDSTITHQFEETYIYQTLGNNLIGITIHCSKSSDTFYKPIYICSSNVDVSDPIKLKSNFLLYPNPASDILIVSMDNYDNEPITLNIYNIFGSLVQSEILHSDHQTISVENLSNGIYIMEMRSKDWIEKQKMIIHKPGH